MKMRAQEADMKKSERMNGIVFALQEQERMTARRLSEMFEVSMRTIYRDIDALSQLKVPIITYEGSCGGYGIDPDYFLPSIRLHANEVTMLLMVLKAGYAMKFPGMTGDYSLLRAKLLNGIVDADRADVRKILEKIEFDLDRIRPPHYTEDVLKCILESFRLSKNMRMTYYTPARDTVSSREVSPQKLFFDIGGWYLSAYCHLRQEKRVFRLDRIKTCALLDTTNDFENVIISSSSDKFELRSYQISIRQPLFRVLKDNLLFERVEIQEERVEIRENADTGSGAVVTLDLRTPYREELTQLIMSRPEDITVIGPEEYVAFIRSKVQCLSEKYK